MNLGEIDKRGLADGTPRFLAAKKHNLKESFGDKGGGESGRENDIVEIVSQKKGSSANI